MQTAARGLGIDDDLVSYVNSMIPNTRGFDWSLHDCYYGNDEDRKPISAFKAVMDENKLWWELAQNIEGLITHLGVHASGIVCSNGDINEFCSIMQTNNGQLVTSLDLHTLESCGGLKYDALTVSALDRIHQAMNYMLEDGAMKWQGTLKDTYDKYLAPSVLNYTDEKMWDMLAEGKISNVFQFDTTVGSQAIKLIRPRNLKQLAIANSVMRLMSSEGEQPLETYAKYKSAPQLWYDEMVRYHLTADEEKVLEKYLKEKDGVGDSQEVIMQLVMDPKISNFDMKGANRLRKTIAKKNFKEIDAVKAMFYEEGTKNGTRKELLDYVWNVQVSRQLG